MNEAGLGPNPWVWVPPLVLFLLNCAVASGRAALVNAHRPQLALWREAGQAGASLAERVAGESRRLITASRTAQMVLRVALVIAFVRLADAVWIPLRSMWLGTLAAEIAGLLLIAFLMASGETLAETLAIRAADRASLFFAPLMAGLEVLFSPFAWIVLRLGGGRSGPKGGAAVVTEEEIKTLIEVGREGGTIEPTEKAMLLSIFQLGHTLVREVMTPRMDLQAVEMRATVPQCVDLLLPHGHSRLPVFDQSIDHVVGLVHAKDLLRAMREGGRTSLQELLRPIYFVPEAKPAGELLAELQSQHIHMAVVVDEYGGTAGLVTIEDLLEEIVGEIRDEYDAGEEAPVVRLASQEYLLDARMNLADVNEVLGTHLSDEFGDTLGGLLYAQLGKVPERGESAWAEGYRLVVEQISGRRIRKVRAVRISENLDPPTKEVEREP